MHPLLERQIKRHLKAGYEIPEDFLNAIAMAYEQADKDRQLIEHSLELMSSELTERNNELRSQLAEQLELVKRLEDAQAQLLQSDKMASLANLQQELLTRLIIPLVTSIPI